MMRTIYITEEQLKNIEKQLDETRACLGASYGSVRHLAHEVKEGDPDAIDRAGIMMSKHVPFGSALIPVPQHSGKAEYTLKLAQRIAQLTKSKVFDILSSPSRKSTLYLQKRRGEDVNKINLGFSAYYDKNTDAFLKKTRNVILIDNAIDSGLTYDQAVESIRQAYNVEPWLLVLGAVTNPKDKSHDIIRSIYPTYKLYEEEENELVNILCEALDSFNFTNL